jgi:ABC-2 type transport system permease protein
MSARPQQYGEIFDRGYAHYDGPRLGMGRTIWALVRYSMGRALGMRRPWTAKIIPMLLYAAVAIPVLISIGIRAFVPRFQFLDYPSFFGAIFLLEGIYVAMIAPELVSSDRHDRLLPLYFSRPIGRNPYVVAKLLATGLLTLTMSLLPAMVLWLGNGFLAQDPIVAMRNGLPDLGRIILAGVLIGFYLGAIGLAIASFTGRKSVAVGIIVLGFVISESLSLAIWRAFADEGWSRWAFILSPSRTSAAMVTDLWQMPDFLDVASLYEAIGVMLAVIALCCAVMFGWYQRRD